MEPMILYCVSAFSEVLTKKWSQKKLLQIQRGFALKISRCYRTTSTDAAGTLSGIEPLYLTGIHRVNVTNIKKGRLEFNHDNGWEIERPSHHTASGYPAHEIHPIQRCCQQEHDLHIYTDGSTVSNKAQVSDVHSLFIKATPKYCIVSIDYHKHSPSSKLNYSL